MDDRYESILNEELRRELARIRAENARLREAAQATLDLWHKHGFGDDHNESDPVYSKLHLALAGEGRKPTETEYQKALRTGKRPAIWPPISMTQEDLEHFRKTHGIE